MVTLGARTEEDVEDSWERMSIRLLDIFTPHLSMKSFIFVGVGGGVKGLEGGGLRVGWSVLGGWLSEH